jgi:hypothetical protein
VDGGGKNKGSYGRRKRKENVKKNKLKGKYKRIRKKVERNGNQIRRIWKGKRNNKFKK